MKKVLTCVCVAFLLLATDITVANHSVFAASDLKSLQKKEEKIKKEQSNVSKDQKKTDEKIKANIEDQRQMEQEIIKIDQELADTQIKLEQKELEIKETNAKIDQLQEEIDQLENEIKEIKKRIQKREGILKNRLLSMQKTGGSMQYIEVLLGSQNFSDFISRSLAVNTIMDQDQLIIDEHKADKASLEKKQNKLVDQKKSLKEQKDELEEQKAELVTLKSHLDQQSAKRKKLMKQLKIEYDQLEEHKMSLEEEQNILKEQERIIQQEKGKLQQLRSNTGGGSGVLRWPTNGRISSPYGQRSFNGGGFHYGIDIAAPKGTPVTAAASGVVTRASYSPSYGNVVFIHHPQLNKSTVYAHMNTISVSAGSKVSSGQQVGTVGNTGNSFGNHLHFEVHNGLWSRYAGINPMNFLN